MQAAQAIYGLLAGDANVYFLKMALLSLYSKANVNLTIKSCIKKHTCILPIGEMDKLRNEQTPDTSYQS